MEQYCVIPLNRARQKYCSASRRQARKADPFLLCELGASAEITLIVHNESRWIAGSLADHIFFSSFFTSAFTFAQKDSFGAFLHPSTTAGTIFSMPSTSTPALSTLPPLA
jgi:hypothetical protein